MLPAEPRSSSPCLGAGPTPLAAPLSFSSDVHLGLLPAASILPSHPGASAPSRGAFSYLLAANPCPLGAALPTASAPWLPAQSHGACRLPLASHLDFGVNGTPTRFRPPAACDPHRRCTWGACTWLPCAPPAAAPSMNGLRLPGPDRWTLGRHVRDTTDDCASTTHAGNLDHDVKGISRPWLRTCLRDDHRQRTTWTLDVLARYACALRLPLLPATWSESAA